MVARKVNRPGTVFLSYHRGANDVARFVSEVLEPMLRDRLPHHGVMSPLAVFRDERTLQPGEDWPDELRAALRAADVMVAVLSPGYFDRPWCLAEYFTMYERQLRLGVPCLEPLRFSDGDFFPDEARRLGWTDLDPGAADPAKPRHVYLRKPSRATRDFWDLVDGLCQRIAARASDEPPHDPGWRFVIPEAAPEAFLGTPTYAARGA
jgi:hypothetical protein